MSEPMDPHPMKTLYDEAWKAFSEWVDKWREDHPDDERADYELAIEEYGK